MKREHDRMEQQEKLGYIEGIKAIATVFVFNIHFLNAYYCGIYTLNPEHFHTAAGVEWYIGATPLNIIYAGKLGARIFLSVSAFLLARRFFRNRKSGKKELSAMLVRTCIKKYFRLVLPILAVNILVVILMSLGCFHNDKAAVLANSVEFFGGYNQFSPNLFEAVKEAVWGCFVTGANRYNGPLWFIYYEFWGCMLVAAILAIAGTQKARYFIYIAAAVLLIRTDFLGMILSLAAADLIYTKQSYVVCITKHKWIVWLTLLIALFFATYPSYGDNLTSSVYAIFPPKVLFYYNVAIPTMIMAVSQLNCLQRLLDRRIFAKFNRISYSFYLIHFPMICTVSAAFFTAMYGKMNYHLLAGLNYILTFLASGFAAYLLTKAIDKPGKYMAEKITDCMTA